MKKRVINNFFKIFLVFVIICTFAGCRKAHKHEFGEWQIVREATCEEDGSRTRQCNGCNETINEVIPATGHSYSDWIAEVPSNCLIEGTKGHYECLVCGKHFDNDKKEIENLTLPKGDHNYGKWIEEIPATCKDAGTEGHYECDICQKYFDENKKEITELYIEKAHVLQFVKGTPATCTKDGIMDAYRCLVCRAFFDESGNPLNDRTIKSTGHLYSDWIDEVPATIDANGVKGHQDCLVCNLHFDEFDNEIESLVIPATCHHFSDWIDEVPATCSENGTKGHYECSHCDLAFDENYNVIEDLVILASHDLKFYERLEPTCDNDGHIACYVCKKCSLVFDENKKETGDFILASLGHSFGDWQEEVPATCTKNGVKAHKTCTRCNKNFDNDDKEINIIIRASHNLEMVAEVSATCTSNGREAYGKCLSCNKYFNVFGEEISDLNSLVIPARSHELGDWIDGINATCTDSGLIGHYHCRICNKDYDNNNTEIANIYVEALGHLHTTDEIIPKLDATCTTDGYVAHFECSRCGKITDEFDFIIEDYVIEKRGHTAGEYIYMESPTCIEPGIKGYYKCLVCNERFLPENYYVTVSDEDLVMKALGHKYAHFDKIEPQCESDGRIEHYQCENCYKVFNLNYEELNNDELAIASIGHIYGNWIERVEPTETEDGMIGHYECSRCHYYFDENKYQIGGTIVIPKTVHLFDTAWVDEIPATCTNDGTKGYYKCSHCDKCFDMNYKEITDFTIPAHHNVSELTKARLGKCNESDILISYYYCNDCGNYVDENMNVLKYDDIFYYANRHNYVAKKELSNEWCHVLECSDCGFEKSEDHEYTFTYITKDGIPTQKGVCKICDYEKMEAYRVVNNVYLPTNIYIGYHNINMLLFKIKYRGGEEINAEASSVMSEDDAKKFEEILNSSPDDFAIRKEVFRVSYLNFTDEIEITFKPFVIFGVVTSEMKYQKGHITDIGAINFIYDCNYTDDTGEIINVHGNVIDDGGFDPEFDFTASGITEKTFTIKYSYNGIEYIVPFNFVATKAPAYIIYDEYHNLILGEALTVLVYYSDGSNETVTVTSGIIINGSFDNNTLGKQTFTIAIEGLTKIITVNVRDPYDVSYIYPENDTLSLGESLKIHVDYLSAPSTIIDATSNMIEGVLNYNEAGTYTINLVYGGKVWTGDIRIVNPNDTRILSIESYTNDTLVWDVLDGKVVENIDYLYINVKKYNNTSEYVKVTSDMISYDKDIANGAIENGETFKLLITYYGKSCYIYVTPNKLADCTIYSMHVYDKTKLISGISYNIFMCDGNLSNYFLYVYTNKGYYCLPVTKDMFYMNDTLEAFDVDNALSGNDYHVIVKYLDSQTSGLYLVKYTEADIEYYFSLYNSLRITVGTKEEVINRLKGARFILNMGVCGHSLSLDNFYFEDLVLAKCDDVDFTKPGYIELTASYKGITGTFNVTLIPNVEGVEYSTYKISNYETLKLYKNGYACINDDMWGDYTIIDDPLILYRVNIFTWSEYMLFVINGDLAVRYKALMLEDNYETYSMYTMDGLNTVNIYTRNAFSLADIYNENGDYNTTYIVSFSADGKYVYMNGVEYLIGENNLLTIVQRGNIVYRYLEEMDANTYIKGTLNDNGLFYISIVNDEVKEENVIAVFTWKEKDGIISIYSNGMLNIKGVIVDGYLVIDDSHK